MRKNFVYYGKINKDKLGYSKKDRYKYFIVAGEYDGGYLCLFINSRHYEWKDLPLARCMISPQQLPALEYPSFINVHRPRALKESDIWDVREIQELDRATIATIKKIAQASMELFVTYRNVINKM